MDRMVEVDDVRKRFRLGTKIIEVLRGVSFQVHTGETVGIVGPSGAGKSTLLHILGTLDTPTSGRLVIDGKDVFRSRPNALASFRNKRIGFVFQFHHLLPEFTALENTMMPALIQRIPRPRAAELASEMLGRVGLGERLDHRPVELSGGEQQRVALARALVLRPRLLLADEPTGNLDEETSEGIHRLLFDLNSSLGMTTIIVTHNRNLALQMQRRLDLRDGRIQETPVGQGEAQT